MNFRYHRLILPLVLAVAACQGNPPVQPGTTAAGTAATSPATAGPGQGVIKGVVTAEGVSAAAFKLLQAKGGKGKVKAVSPIDTKEVECAADGTFSCVVKGGADYTLEASVPDGRGGVLKVVSAKVTVPLANDPPIVDAQSLVTRRTGSIQGLIQLKDARPGETAEGADVFLSGGSATVGKAGETGRFALIGIAEGTWNVVVMKPGYKRVVLKDLAVKAGKPLVLDQAIALERDVEQKAGIKGVVQSSSGAAIAGATISAFPKDRAALTGSDAGLDNFTAITDDQGGFEMLNLPPGDYQVQVYRPFYNLPPRQDVAVTANVTSDLGPIKLTSTVAYFGKISGRVVDEAGQPLDGAVIQIDPPVTETQQADARGNFTLDRVLPGEYNLSVAAAGYKVYETLAVVENVQNYTLAFDRPFPLAPGATKVPPAGPPAPTDPATPAPTSTPAPVAPTPAPAADLLVNGGFGGGASGWTISCHNWGAYGGGAWPEGHCGAFHEFLPSGLRLAGSVAPYDGPYLKAIQTVDSGADVTLRGTVDVQRLGACHNGVFVIAELLDSAANSLGQITYYTLGGGCDWYTNSPTSYYRRQDTWGAGAGPQPFTMDVGEAPEFLLPGVRSADVRKIRVTLQTYSDLSEADAVFGGLSLTRR